MSASVATTSGGSDVTMRLESLGDAKTSWHRIDQAPDSGLAGTLDKMSKLRPLKESHPRP